MDVGDSSVERFACRPQLLVHSSPGAAQNLVDFTTPHLREWATTRNDVGYIGDEQQVLCPDSGRDTRGGAIAVGVDDTVVWLVCERTQDERVKSAQALEEKIGRYVANRSDEVGEPDELSVAPPHNRPVRRSQQPVFLPAAQADP